jgi:hypothetical protein
MDTKTHKMTHKMTEQESKEIRDAVTSAFGGVVESMSKLLEQRKTSETDEPDKTDEETTTETDDEIGHRAVEQYINAMNTGNLSGKDI